MFKRLVETSAFVDALAYTACRALTPQDAVRLCALAYLHDLGKANRGFWARQFEGSRIVGHTNETVALFHTDLAERSEACGLLEMIEDWGAEELFVAVMAHHGRPLYAYSRQCSDPASEALRHRIHWRARDGYDPMAELARLQSDVRARFPLAFESGPKLPDKAPFVALVGGLVTLADWLGSDARLFPVVGPHFAARERVRADGTDCAVSGRGLARLEASDKTFEEVFGFVPRGVQAEAARLDLGPVALIEAETGSGKTEAALWRWLALRRAGRLDGLYFALPTRSAAVQLHGRVQRMLDRVFVENRVEAVLAVPGYLRAGDAEGQALPGFEVVWPDGGEQDSRWSAEASKRFLSARVAVGTIDQALMAGLQLRHAHFRAAMLVRSLLVVDEVHASDAFMGEVLRAVIRNHVALGGEALLLSATLGADMRTRLLDLFGRTERPSADAAAAIAYPAISGSGAPPLAVAATGAGKRVWLEPAPLIDDADAVAIRAIEAAGAGASVLVVRNSVQGAVAVARTVEALAPELAFCVNGVATLHHGRFAPSDRRLLDRGVEEAFGKERSARGRVLAGTQTLEQSLDIDADLLITDLCPMDVLLQRIGRLHRHLRKDRGGFDQARTIVLTAQERDLSRYLGRVGDRHGLGPLRDGLGVYSDLLVIEATLRLIEANPAIDIPADNRRLVEGALHPDVLEALAAELGPEWMNHAAQQGGIAIYERGLARDLSLDVCRPFTSLHFPPVEEKVATRLGTTDRLVDFEAPIIGPFDVPVQRLTIPGWMTGGIGADAEAELLSQDVAGFSFRLGERHFRYDRFGLASVSQSQSDRLA